MKKHVIVEEQTKGGEHVIPKEETKGREHAITEEETKGKCHTILEEEHHKQMMTQDKDEILYCFAENRNIDIS